MRKGIVVGLVVLAVCLMGAFLFFSSLLWAEEEIHWFEAEEFKGNGTIVKDSTASGGACVEGKTNICFIMNVPYPQKQKKYNVWARLQSDVPASWYLLNRETKKVVSWHKTEEPEKWIWVRLGVWSASQVANGKTFWSVYLQNPVNYKEIPTAYGKADVLVVTDINDPAILDKYLERRKNFMIKSQEQEVDLVKLAQLQNLKQLTDCTFVSEAPVLDGQLNDSAWKKTQVLSDFLLMQRKGLAKEQTRVRLAYDKKNLYIAAELMERQIQLIRKTKTMRNDNVWLDDCLEIFLDVGFTGEEYYHFIVNALGAQEDNLHKWADRADIREGDWRTACSILSDRWVAEIVIPFSLLSRATPKNGEIWGLNICREERPLSELSSWNQYPTGSFHNVNAFGLLSFGTKPISLEGINIQKEKSKTLVLLKNNTASEQNVHLDYKIIHDERKIFSRTEKVSLAKKSSKSTEFSLETKGPGTYQVHFFVSDDKNKPYYDFNISFKTYSESLISAAYPSEYTENKLYFARNTTQHTAFILANHSKATVNNPKLCISVPQGIEILDPSDSLHTGSGLYYPVTQMETKMESKKGKPYRKYIFSLGRAIAPCHIEKQRFFQGVLIFFKIVGSVPDKFPIYYYLEGGKEKEEEKSFQVEVLAPAKGKQPAEIVIEMSCWTINPGLHTFPAVLDTYKQIGFNSVDPFIAVRSPELMAEVKKRGFDTVRIMWWFWWYDAYLNEHPDSAAVNYAGKKDKRKLCPTLLIENDGKLLIQSLDSRFDAIKNKGIRGIDWDLEGPSCWDVCFCPRCIKSFRKFAEIPDKTPLDPKEIRKKYSRKWIEFCCGQSTEMARLITAHIRSINKKATFGVYSGVPGLTTMENYRVNWDEIVKVMDIAYPTGYGAKPEFLATGFKQMVKKYKQMNPNLDVHITLAAGWDRPLQVVGSPKLAKMQILRSIASGADGIHWWYWGPLDGRYYQKFAEATTIISGLEPFFIKGKERDNLISLNNPYGKGISFAGFQLNDCQLIMFFNHSSAKKRDLSFSLLDVAKGSTGYSYPELKEFNLNKKITLSIDPLEVSSFIVGPKGEINKLLQD